MVVPPEGEDGIGRTENGRGPIPPPTQTSGAALPSPPPHPTCIPDPRARGRRLLPPAGTAATAQLAFVEQWRLSVRPTGREFRDYPG